MTGTNDDISRVFSAFDVTLRSGSVSSFSATIEGCADSARVAQSVVDLAPSQFLVLQYDSLRLDLLPLPCLVVCDGAETVVVQKAGANWVTLSGSGYSSRERIKRLDFELRFKPKHVVVHRGFMTSSFRFVDYVKSYARGNARRLMSGFFGSVAGHIASLFMPIGALLIIDKVLGHNGVGTLDVIIALLIGAELLRFFMTTSRNIVLGELADEFVHETQSLLFQMQANRRNPHFKPTSHELYRTLKHIEKTRKIFADYTVALLADMVFLLVLIAVMFLLSPLLAKIAMVGLAINIASTIVTSFLRRDVARRRMEVTEGSDETYVELLTTGVDRRLMGRQHNTLRDWNENIDANLRFEAQGDEYKFAPGPLNTLLLNCLRATVMWFGAIEALNGMITVGQFIAFNLVVALSLGPISKIAAFVSDVTELKRSARTVKDSFARPMEQDNEQSLILPSPKGIGTIEFKDVELVTPGKGEVIVSAINLRIPAGEKIAIMGGSGVGKSTFLSAVLGDERCYTGEIYAGNDNLHDMSLSAYRRRIGVLSQGAGLADGTLLSNLHMGDRDYDLDKIYAALESAKILDRVKALEDGLDTHITTKDSPFSQGEKQRILLARAYLHGAEMLLLDEPTSALDETTEAQVAERLIADHSGKTLIVSTHSLALAEEFDRVFLIKDKRLIEFSGADVKAGALVEETRRPSKGVVLHEAFRNGARKDGGR
ncbi:peptidase domain-containing ABC transporter [Shimia ponticola]|uniref:peptidase domain-containing ABC transporter n=1 Tax=Shimia ponticola TaxID=2582893 RepID=UPI00164C5509|nr:ATP-binding cassette domain-containing protein [Shimia ponticola]